MTGMEVLSTAEMKELWIAGIGRLGITERIVFPFPVILRSAATKNLVPNTGDVKEEDPSLRSG